MSHDSEIAEVGRAMKEARQKRHSRWKEENMKLFEDSEFFYVVTNGGEAFLFRNEGKPFCDFYPSTGRWRVVGQKKTYRGGGKAFLGWYRGQKQ